MQKTNVALKYDNEKPGMDLLPVEAKRAIARVFDFGAKKYARHNWRSGFEWSRLIAAAERHIDAFNAGEDNDPESGESHLAHAGCCIMMLLESVIKNYGTDNRFKAEVATTYHVNPALVEIQSVNFKGYKPNYETKTDSIGINTVAEQMTGLNDAIKKIEKNGHN